MIVHFIYSVPPETTYFRRGLRGIRRKLQLISPSISLIGNRSDIDVSAWPTRAPYTITRYVFEALSKEFETRLYHLSEHHTIRGGTDHILIGHPLSPDTVWMRSMMGGTFAARIAMQPIHYGMPHYLMPLDQYIDAIDLLLGITGPYWAETWSAGPFAHWAPKLVHVDMAVNASNFPRVKTRFNPPGQRKFFFVGNGEPYKGAHLLSILFGLAPHMRCVWISGEPGFPNLQIRAEAHFTREYVERLSDEVDFFITLGISDANPTTILEAMAWGFPVLCTPQSGYAIPEVFRMSTNDMTHNVAMLERLQWCAEEELLQHADRARRLVEERFHWDRFRTTVVNEVKAIARRKALL